jgi:hypothetical protein
VIYLEETNIHIDGWTIDYDNDYIICHLPRQNMTIDIRITMTDIIAITRAHWEVSGYSNKSQTLRWTSFLGNIRSSSLIKPSSSRNLLNASSPNSKNFISSVNTSKNKIIEYLFFSCMLFSYQLVHDLVV